MPTVQLSPDIIQRFVDSNGNALVGGKLFTYAAGTTTKQATYTDSTGVTQQSNPIIMNSRGEPENNSGTSLGIWLDPTLTYKFVLSPSTDTDPPTNPIWTLDNVPGSGIAPGSITGSQIATSTITGGNIAATTITGGNLANGTITTTQIAAGTILSSNIATSTITGANIASGTITSGNLAANAAVTQLNQQTGVVVLLPSAASGRLYLTSGTPVTTTTVSGSTNVYFGPFNGNQIPLWNGTLFVPTTFAELTNVLANSSTGNAGPFGAAANAVYDLFVWSNSGTPTLTRGDYWQQTATVTNTNASPAVFTHTAHGLIAGAPVRLAVSGGSLSPNFAAGTTYYVVNPTTNTYDLSATVGGSAINAGGASSGTITATEGIGVVSTTTNTPARGTVPALNTVGGFLVNNANIANGPNAGLGTYVGTISTNTASTLDFIFGGSASGGTAGRLMVWNTFNRILTVGTVVDSGTAYAYATATIRQARASAGNQITFVLGQQWDIVKADYNGVMATSSSTAANLTGGIGLDTTTAYSSPKSVTTTAGNVTILGTLAATYNGSVGIGVHVISANENGDGSNGNAFDDASTNTLTVVIPL